MLGRLLTSRILSTFLIILSVLTMALTAMQFVRLGPLFLGPWVRPSDAGCLVALVPFLALGIPASLALACSLVAAGMSRRREREALSGAGVSPLRVAILPLALAAAATIVTGLLSITAVPRSFAFLERSLASLATRAAFASLPEGRFFDMPGSGVLYAGERSGDLPDLVLRDVLVSYEIEDASIVISSPSVNVGHHGSGECTFLFSDASLRISTGRDESVTIEAGSIGLPVNLGEIIRSRSDTLPQVLSTTTGDLLSGEHGAAGRYHLHRRLALPIASLAILLISGLFFFLPTLARPAVPPAVTAGALVVFHGLMRASEEASTAGVLAPELAAWIPAVVLAAAAAVTLYRVSRARTPSLPASA